MEPFKDYLNQSVVRQLGQIFARVYEGFDEVGFCNAAETGLLDLELKERALHIMTALDSRLPADFSAFSAIILACLHPCDDSVQDKSASFGPKGVMGFAAWPVTDLVTKRGLDQPDLALPLLKEVTKRFSAEFAVRPFLDQHTAHTLAVFDQWSEDESRHVRRLVSEGTRPRLPWGMQLRKFIDDPSNTLPLLEKLKDDPEEYVRRSVANHLNDIAKDHPDKVAEIAVRWLEGADKNRKRLVKHACRTLIKQGHKGVLSAFGYDPLAGLVCELKITSPTVDFGGTLDFEADFSGSAGSPKIMVDYAIHFVKANGSTVPKMFKWKDTVLTNGAVQACRKHAIKPITTRKYYHGEHWLEIFVNGVSVAKKSFILRL